MIRIVLSFTPDEIVDKKGDYVHGSPSGRQPLTLAVLIGVAVHGEHLHPVVEEKADCDDGSPPVRHPLPIVIVVHAVHG